VRWCLLYLGHAMATRSPCKLFQLQHDFD
jgi:hypothetical protein